MDNFELDLASDDEDEVDERIRSSTNFDLSLASQHQYLGDVLETTQGTTIFDENSIISIPIILEMDLVLFPGQILPMTILYPPTVDLLRQVIATDKTFGVSCLKAPHSNFFTISKIGTTAEVIEYFYDEPMSGLRIKARGRQRYMLISREQQSNRTMTGKVMIIPEVSLPVALPGALHNSLSRFRKNSNYKKTLRVRDLSGVTWPGWVVDNFEVGHLVETLHRLLVSLHFIKADDALPLDTLGLSYYVSRMLPVDDAHRVKLLGFHTPLERIQYAIKMLGECRHITCSNCNVKVGSRRHIFSTSVDGPTGLYCNPGGFLHDVITLYAAKSLSITEEAPSEEYSWFPGYAWNCAMCSNCHHHSGWLFTAVSDGLQPRKFWGLRKTSVTMNRKSTHDEHFIVAQHL